MGSWCLPVHIVFVESLQISEVEMTEKPHGVFPVAQGTACNLQPVAQCCCLRIRVSRL